MHNSSIINLNLLRTVVENYEKDFILINTQDLSYML